MRGEKIYEYDLDVTGMTDYGVSLDGILSGEEPIPPQGARIDIAFEGRASGRLPIADLLENVRLTTAAEDYAWVNTRRTWSFGTVNFATGNTHIDGFMQ